jgi:hypothetical protein
MPNENDGSASTESEAEDKTSKNEILAGIPSEGEELDGIPAEGEDEKSEEKPEPKKEEAKKDSKPSSVYQKERWRDRAKEAEIKVEQLSTQITQLLEANKGHTPPDDATEKAAQDYIDKRIDSLLIKREEAKKNQERIKVKEFENELEEILEEYPDFTEKQIMDICEEDDVKPRHAARILKRLEDIQSKSKPKPKMPLPKRGATEISTPKSEDKKGGGKKDLWEIAKEAKEMLKNLT